MEAFSAKWFLIYYIIFGLLLVGAGLWLVIKKQPSSAFLASAATQKQPPRLFISILKYLLLFTIPGLLLSIIYFSWVELIFSLWCLLLVYLGGIQLVRWEQTKALIETNKSKLTDAIGRCGAI